ncbi:hypothetical protein Tco_0863449 [Tanacetum coccineum]
MVTGFVGAGTKYQVDQTQSTRLEVSDPDDNKGKTSSEVEPDIEPLILYTFGEIRDLLKILRRILRMKEPQPTEHHSPEPSKEKSPFLHISPEPSLEAPKKPKKSKKRRVRRSQLEPSLEASKEHQTLPEHSDFESSVGSLDFKAFDNNV